jgi:DNA-binding MarR family transcriptional regulator
VNLTPAGLAVVARANESLTALRLDVFAGVPRRDIEAALRVFAAIEAAATETPVTSSKG